MPWSLYVAESWVVNYMWQSQVEIEHYSIVYFDLTATFKAPQCFERDNMVEIRALN